MLKKIIAIFLFFICCSNKATAEQLTAEDDQIIAEDYLYYQKAEVIILNKITSKSERITLEIEQQYEFGTLSMMLNKCIIDTSKNGFKDGIALTIIDYEDKEDVKIVFDGWLFPHNLSINSFEHSVFEVIPVKCKQ
ncbi:MAG: hypothetical protein DGJ47_000852 [Rickettsiaceae bacterium]